MGVEDLQKLVDATLDGRRIDLEWLAAEAATGDACLQETEEVAGGELWILARQRFGEPF